MKITRLLCSVVLAFMFAAHVSAQESLDVGEIYLGSSGCRVSVGTGSPDGAVTGKTCDVYLQTDSTGGIWVKTTSSGTSGWALALTPAAGASGTVLAGGTPAAFTDTPTVSSLTTGLLTANELRVETLVAADVMSTMGGRLLVAPTTVLTSDLSDSATSMTVRNNNFASGDRLVLKSGTATEYLAVTSGPSGTGPYTYSVTRDFDGSGADAWPAGSAVVSTSLGYIDLFSDHALLPEDAFGPSIVGMVRTGTAYDAVAPRWALGNLDGLFGYTATTYGMAAGNPSGAWFKVDPDNGVRIGYGTTDYIAMSPDGAPRITLQSTDGSATGLQFKRAVHSGFNWGGSDEAALWLFDEQAEQQLNLHNLMGVSDDATGDGRAIVDVRASGMDHHGVAQAAAAVRLQSDIAISRVTISAGTTSLIVSTDGATTLDGALNVGTGYQVNGTAGITATNCDGTQPFTVKGGLITACTPR
jgi:hypothetical protein